MLVCAKSLHISGKTPTPAIAVQLLLWSCGRYGVRGDMLGTEMIDSLPTPLSSERHEPSFRRTRTERRGTKSLASLQDSGGGRRPSNEHHHSVPRTKHALSLFGTGHYGRGLERYWTGKRGRVGVVGNTRVIYVLPEVTGRRREYHVDAITVSSPVFSQNYIRSLCV